MQTRPKKRSTHTPTRLSFLLQRIRQRYPAWRELRPPECCSTAAPDRAQARLPAQSIGPARRCRCGWQGRQLQFVCARSKARVERRKLPRSAAIDRPRTLGRGTRAVLHDCRKLVRKLVNRRWHSSSVTQKRKSARSSLSLRPLGGPWAVLQAWVRRLSGRATARDSSALLRPHQAARNPSWKKSFPPAPCACSLTT